MALKHQPWSIYSLFMKTSRELRIYCKASVWMLVIEDVKIMEEKLSINFCPIVVSYHVSMFVWWVSMSMSAPMPPPSSLWLLTPLAAGTRCAWKPSQGWGGWRRTLGRTRTRPGERLSVLIIRDNAAMTASRHPTFVATQINLFCDQLDAPHYHF